MDDIAGTTRDHEFTEEQNADLRAVGSHAITWGFVCVSAGVACIGLGLLGATGKLHGTAWRLVLPSGVINSIAGVNFLIAGRDFRAAVHTQGCDVRHVMEGLTHLSRAILVQILLGLATIALVVLGAQLSGGH